MNWIEIVYTMMGGACLTLSIIHLFVWLQQRDRYAHLLFSFSAVLVSILMVCELLLLQAPTPQYYSNVLRLVHVVIGLFIPSILGFVWFDLRAGWTRLALVAVVLRTAAVAANFLTGDNLNFSEMTGLKWVEAWGHQFVVVPLGIPNPWMILGPLSNLFVLCFMASVIVSVVRQNDAARRRRALLICGSIILCVVVSNVMTIAMVLGKSQIPLALNLTIFPVILVMSYILGGDVIRSSRLSQELLCSEHSLRESEQRMMLATTAADIGLWIWNLDEDISWFSKIGSKLLGIAPDTRVSRDTFLGMVHAEDRQAILRARDEAVHGSGEYSVEYRMPQADGRMRWIAARGRAEPKTPDSPVMVRGVLVDITKRRQAEERFKLVVDGAPIGMLVCSASGCISLANLHAERMFGYERNELLEQSIDMLLPQALRAAHAQHRNTFIADPRPRAMGEGRELFGLRKDGGEVPVEIGLTPIEINDALHILVSITDITERKRMEKESALQRAELAHLSRVTLLGELSGSLAHELNQPLTAVLSNAQAALRFMDHDPPNLGEVRESLVHIVENDKRASEVIRRLRAMLRKESIEHAPLAINEVLQDVVRLINSDLLNRGIAVSLILAPNLSPISGDRVQLQQVLLNLVINACDAMQGMDGERTVTIRTRLTQDSAIEVTISDIGHSIPSDDLEHIFSPFVTTKPEGIGLGLAICRSIIQSHRGKLWATNNEGRGSTLHFTLPVSADLSSLA